MRLSIEMWGHSLAVRLPKAAVEAVGLRDSASLDLTIQDGALVFRPGRWDIKTLVALIKGNPPPLEWDDIPRGCELGQPPTPPLPRIKMRGGRRPHILVPSLRDLRCSGPPPLSPSC
ncbi:hypothetical protein BH10PSE4_BH10PSE4_33880 [soil metagenome]